MIVIRYDGDKQVRTQIALSDELEQFVSSDKKFVRQLRQVEDYFDYAKCRSMLVTPKLIDLVEAFKKYNPNVVETDVIQYIQQEIQRKLKDTEFHGTEVRLRFLSKKHKITINR
jgi:hypothetical protein